MGSGRSPKRRVRDDDFILGYRRIIPRISSNRLSKLAEALQGVSDEILSFKISCQAQCLVRLEGDFSCSVHWKWRFICAADRWWHWFCVAGAAFGEVGCWLYLLRALEMTFHMWCGIVDDLDFVWQGAVFGEVGRCLILLRRAFVHDVSKFSTRRSTGIVQSKYWRSTL